MLVGGSVTELQYRIILDNLAMLSASPAVLPWHMQLDEGTVQVTDRREGVFELARLAEDIDPRTAIRGRRSVTGQWRIEPVLDPERLRGLQAVYLKTLGRDVEDEVLEELGDAADVSTGWVRIGRRREVPPETLYSGRYGETYVWVVPDDLEALTRLAIAVLTIVQRDEGEISLRGGGLVPVSD